MGNNKMLFMIINGIIAVLCLVGVYFVFQSMQVELDPETNQAISDTSAVDVSMTFSLWFSVGSLALIALFTIWAIVDNPKRFIISFIGLAIFGIVFFIAFSMAAVETSGPVVELEYATEGWIKWSGVGILMTYILVFLAAVLIIAQGVRQVLGFFAK